MRNSSHIPLPSFLRPSALPAPRRPSRASPSLLRPSVIPAPLRPSRPPPSFRAPFLPLRPSFLRPSVIPAFLRPSVIPAPLRHSCVGRNPRDRSTWLHASTADVPPNPPNAAAWRWSAVEHLGSAQGPSDRLDSCLRRACPWLEQGNDRGRGGSEAGGGRMADGPESGERGKRGSECCKGILAGERLGWTCRVSLTSWRQRRRWRWRADPGR